MSSYCEESYVIYDEQTPKARKEHQCEACERTIRKGERYNRVFTLFDGEKTHYKRCDACQVTHERLACGDSYESRCVT